jgi:hypothetical protein
VSAYDACAPIYDEWAEHMTEDVGFYVELAREIEGPLVELAVGSGRVAIPVARETGRPVLGREARTLSLWWCARSEWQGLLEVSGLETEALYGRFDRRPFDERARKFACVARKRA